MLRITVAAGAAFSLTLLAALGTATPAAAFGDVCLDEVVARGAWKASYSAAIKSSQRAWGPVAAKKFGRRFASYSYSGERQFTCIWNDAGTRYRCTVSARACGSKKGR